jgi:hypothetical protein
MVMWVDRLKWVSTACVLFGIFLTNLNIYPMNLAFHFVGVLIWTWVGYVKKDGAIMTNFGLQIPLFLMGWAHFFSGLD